MAESVSGGRVKGAIVRAHEEWVKVHEGDATLEKALTMLQPDVAKTLRRVVASSWIPFGTLVAFDRAIAQATNREERALCRELGRFSANQNLTGIYRVFKREDIHDFFKRGAALHSQFQDFGSQSYEVTSQTSATIRFPAEYFSPVYCASAIGYFEEVIRIHGGSSPSVKETHCLCKGDRECVFELHWM